MYVSQSGQDKFVDNFFNYRTKGIFLDIGANDGITLSNTFFLEKEREWTGFCFEPIQEVYKKLKSNRNCQCINAGVFSESGEFDFYEVKGYSEMLSGLEKTIDNRHLERIKREINQYGGSLEVKKVKCININDFLIQNKCTKIDYCSIDTEGSEIEILKSIDFSKINIKVITVENNFNENTIFNYMLQNGYVWYTKLAHDDVFIKI